MAYGSSERRACRVLTFGRSTCRYESVAAEQAALRMRIRDLAASRVSYGYRRIVPASTSSRLVVPIGEAVEAVEANINQLR